MNEIPEIKPKYINGEPVCDGGCSHQWASIDSWHCDLLNDEWYGNHCIPALRRDRDEKELELRHTKGRLEEKETIINYISMAQMKKPLPDYAISYPIVFKTKLLRDQRDTFEESNKLLKEQVVDGENVLEESDEIAFKALARAAEAEAERDELKDNEQFLRDQMALLIERVAVTEQALKESEECSDDYRLKAVALNTHITQLKNELAEYEGKPEAFERLRELLRKEKEMRKRGEDESRGLRGDVKMAESQYEAMRHSQEYHIERASNAEKRTEQARATAARFMEEAGKWKKSQEFYRRRCELLQSRQHTMRDPERTLVCDILANGLLLPDVSGERYGQGRDDVECTSQEGIR